MLYHMYKGLSESCMANLCMEFPDFSLFYLKL